MGAGERPGPGPPAWRPSSLSVLLGSPALQRAVTAPEVTPDDKQGSRLSVNLPKERPSSAPEGMFLQTSPVQGGAAGSFSMLRGFPCDKPEH